MKGADRERCEAALASALRDWMIAVLFGVLYRHAMDVPLLVCALLWTIMAIVETYDWVVELRKSRATVERHGT